jgi:hypothetical protein
VNSLPSTPQILTDALCDMIRDGHSEGEE